MRIYQFAKAIPFVLIQVRVVVGDTKSQYTSKEVTLTLLPGRPKYLELASDTLGIKTFQEEPEAPMHSSMEVS